MSLAAGTRLGPYEVVSLLGSGGMGEVYRARDPRLSREVAIKVLPPELAADQDRVQRFQVEARAAGALNHPNILSVYDAGNDSGLAFIVSELLEGRTLRGLLTNGRLGERKSVGLAVQMVRGLASAHARGIVHRDLKPENIFVTNDAVVKILDFGLAKLLAGTRNGEMTRTIATSTGVVMGTAGYMSPEQLRGTTVDTHSDLFSFGAVLYEMLSGRKAFAGNTAADSASAILKDDPQDLDRINPALNRIVLRCLEKDPKDRFDSARDLAFALEALSGSLTSDKHKPIAHVRKNARLWAVVAPAAVIGLAAAGWFLARTPPAPPIPTYKRITFATGVVSSARFTPEGSAVVYSASWRDAPEELFSVRLDQPEARSLDVRGTQIVSISTSGDMALLRRPTDLTSDIPGILARAPLSGGATRDMLQNVIHADWSGSEIAIVRRVQDKFRLEMPPGHTLYEGVNRIGWMRVHPGRKLAAVGERPSGMGSRWILFTVDANGRRRDVARDLEGENIQFTWADDEQLLFQTGSIAGGEIKSVSLDGKIVPLYRFPVPSDIFEVSKDGRMLIRRTLWRASLIASTRKGGSDRDLSWMDASEVDAITPDGKQLLITEFGEGGGVDTWSVYLRNADGTSAVRLAEGQAMAFSPDRQFALTMKRGNPPRLMLVPTGAGEAKEIPNSGFMDYTAGVFMRDAKTIVLAGTHKIFGTRLFVQDLSSGLTNPVTPVGTSVFLGWHALSPDGKWVIVAGPDRRLRRYSLVNPSLDVHPEAIPGMQPGDRPVRWLAQGKSFYLARVTGATAKLFVVDALTGDQRLWKELRITDPSGVSDIYAFQIAADEETMYYSYIRRLTDLYIVDGLLRR